MIRIQLCQPAHFRDILSFFLGNTDDFHIVKAMDKQISIEKQIRSTQPNVVLLDISEDDDITLIQRIKRCDRSVKIVVLSDEGDVSHVIHCLKKGANGYLLRKKTSLPTLAECIKVVHEGGFPMSPAIMTDVLKMLIPEPAFNSEENETSKLTKRETEILQLLVNGLTYKGVSFHLNIAIDTVRSHIKRIYEKLQVNSKSEAVVKALKGNNILMPL